MCFLLGNLVPNIMNKIDIWGGFVISIHSKIIYWYLFYYVQNQFDLFLKMKKLRSGIPGSSEIQYKESDIDESMSSSSISDNVSNFKKIIMLYTF